MEAIVTRSLTKLYKGVPAVDGLDLTVQNGEMYALLGVNGAGKTTTIRMLSCLTKPSGGDALLHGKSIQNSAREVKSLIAVSPQETAVAPNLTVKENLALMAGVHGFTKEKTKALLSELTEQFGLHEVSGQKAKKLSGGWQRRLSIAMALICEPQILFLDEPTLGLDVLARCELWEVIRRLKGRITIVLTTHYLEEAQALCDRIAIMKRGRLLTVGTAEEIIRNAGTGTFEEAFVKLVGDKA